MKRIHSLVQVNDNMAAQMNSLLNLNSMTEIVQVSFKLLSIHQDYKFEYKNKKKVITELLCHSQSKPS
jgi:hypothetical protein